MNEELNTTLISSATDRLKDLQNKITIKLKSNPQILQRLKILDANPQMLNAFNYRDIQEFYLIKRLVPDLFEEPKSFVKEIAGTPMVGAGNLGVKAQQLQTLEQKQKTAAETIEKLGLTGLVKNVGEALTTAEQKGYLPEIGNKTFWGAMFEGFKFPLQKIMNLVNIYPRAEAELATQVYRKAIQEGKYPTIAEFNWRDYISGKYPKYQNPIEALNIGKEGWKEVAKATFEPLYNVKSPYSGMGWTQAYKEMFKGTKFTEPLFPKAPEEWKTGSPMQRLYYNLAPSETGNWWQRLVSGFVGSPADIVGLASDIAFDPLTYISGGFGKAAKQGVSLADDLIKEGIKILPKGAEIGLTKAGREAFESFSNKLYSGVYKAIDEGLIAPGAIIKGFNATDDVAKQIAKNALKDKALNQFLQEIPDAATTYKYLDLGGTKFMGQTVIPGYKYAEIFGKLKGNKTVKVVGGLINENAYTPDMLVPFKDWLINAGEAERSKFLDEFVNIVKTANESDLDKVQKYLWLRADIERKGNKLDDIVKRISEAEIGGVQGKLFGADAIKSLQRGQTSVSNILKKYYSKIENLYLTDKQLDIANNLKDFWQRRADDFFKATGQKINAYEFYSPIRYIKEEGAFKKISEVGALEQPFTKARKVTQAQAEALGLKPKGLIPASLQRLYEQQKLTFRTRILNQIKQFSSDTAKEGFVKVTDIPELKGFYIPKEFEAVAKNSYNLFFGDDAFKKLLSAYDKSLTIWKRWVLATPGYHFRNFFTDNVSGLMEYGLNFYNPKYWSDAMTILRRQHKLITLNGIKRYADDVYDEMFKTGEIALTTQIAVETRLGQKTMGKMGKVEDIISKISLPEYSLKLGQFRENLGRVVAGVIERDAGASKIMAAANVKKVFFDYLHSLTPFEKNLMKRVAPFYTWLKNNIRRQVELLFTRTGAYAAIPKTKQFIENISEKPEGYEEFKPEYYTDLFAILTPFRAPGLPDWLADWLGQPRTTQAGAPLVFNPNFAFQDFSRFSFKDFLSAVAPQLRVPLELYFDKDVFFGTPIEKDQKYKQISKPLEVALGKLPDSWLDKIGFLKTDDGRVLATPKTFFILNKLPQYALSQRGFGQTEYAPYQRLSMFLGTKYYPYQEEKEKERYISEWMSKASKELSKYEQKTGQELPSTSQIESAYREIYQNAVKEKYADELQLKELLNVVGSNKEMDMLLKEMLKPYYNELEKSKNKNLIDIKNLLKEIGIEPTLFDVQRVLALRSQYGETEK